MTIIPALILFWYDYDLPCIISNIYQHKKEVSLLSTNSCGDDKLQDLIWALYNLQNGLHIPTTAINNGS